MQTISVRPVDGQGWMVEIVGASNAQIFRSGAKAESSAKHLAERLAQAGQPSRVTIYLRDGAVGGRFVATPGSYAL